MRYDPPLKPAVLKKRYKRFLADVRLPDGRSLTLHCPNTGSMKHCAIPGMQAWYSDSGNPRRKYPCTLEQVEVPHGHRAMVNTALPNRLVRDAIEAGRLPTLENYATCQAEVKYGEENSRIDLLLQGGGQPDCYIEVKNVTLGPGPEMPDDGILKFPDAVTTRGQKHLRELMHIRQQGLRAVLFFCVSHTGAREVQPADDIDPVYGALLREAAATGVEILAWKLAMSPEAVSLAEPVPVRLD